MPNTIHCPSCKRELRVPNELVGQRVKCPGCGVIFTATLEQESPPETPVVLAEEESPTEAAAPRPPQPIRREEEYDDQRQAQEYYERPNLRHRGFRRPGLDALRAPAICLLVTGFLGLFGTGYLFVNALFVTPEMAENIKKNQLPPARTPEERRGQEIGLSIVVGPGARVGHFAFMCMNLVIILAAIMMLIGKLKWLVYLGSILAMLNVDCCCCLPGIGFGIWSLVTLNKPEVQEVFD